MADFLKFIFLAVCLALSGCVTSQSRIARERELYLADPAIPRYGYDGKLLAAGEHYRFLFTHDSGFGDFLLPIIAKTKDPRVVQAALTYFASKKPDPVKFEQVVSAIDPRLLDEEVDLSSSDVIMMVSLREWIADTRKWANQALQHNDPSCHESCLRTPRASRGRG
jgi:hypothetical protein